MPLLLILVTPTKRPSCLPRQFSSRIADRLSPQAFLLIGSSKKNCDTFLLHTALQPWVLFPSVRGDEIMRTHGGPPLLVSALAGCQYPATRHAS